MRGFSPSDVLLFGSEVSPSRGSFCVYQNAGNSFLLKNSVVVSRVNALQVSGLKQSQSAVPV